MNQDEFNLPAHLIERISRLQRGAGASLNEREHAERSSTVVGPSRRSRVRRERLGTRRYIQ